jgi:hypothetical protein
MAHAQNTWPAPARVGLVCNNSSAGVGRWSQKHCSSSRAVPQECARAGRACSVCRALPQRLNSQGRPLPLPPPHGGGCRKLWQRRGQVKAVQGPPEGPACKAHAGGYVQAPGRPAGKGLRNTRMRGCPRSVPPCRGSRAAAGVSGVRPGSGREPRPGCQARAWGLVPATRLRPRAQAAAGSALQPSPARPRLQARRPLARPACCLTQMPGVSLVKAHVCAPGGCFVGAVRVAGPGRRAVGLQAVDQQADSSGW